MKKTGIVIFVLLVFMISGCGKSPTVKIVTEEKAYPEADVIISNLENAGYIVEHSGSFEELGIEIDRIIAMNGDEYIDICYNVSSTTDMDMIIEYYMGHYEKYNLVSDTDIVYCYSDESAVESAGL